MRSPFAYAPRPRPLQSASPGAAVFYLVSLLAVAFLWSSSPLVLSATAAALTVAGLLAGARGALWAALRISLGASSLKTNPRCTTSSTTRFTSRM